MRAVVYLSPDTTEAEVKAYWGRLDDRVARITADDDAYEAKLDPRVPKGLCLVVLTPLAEPV